MSQIILTKIERDLMEAWISLTTGALTLVCALLFGIIAIKSKRRTLPRNSIVGIRLVSTLKSDEAWKASHQKTWGISALSSAIFLIGGLLLIFPEKTTEARYILITAVTYGSLIPLLAIQGILANRAADQQLYRSKRV